MVDCVGRPELAMVGYEHNPTIIMGRPTPIEPTDWLTIVCCRINLVCMYGLAKRTVRYEIREFGYDKCGAFFDS